MRIETLLARIGTARDPRTGAISMPIYQTATFSHPGPGESTGYDYSRTQNPTRQALEEGLAALEGGARGLAFGSGMAAITTALMLFRPGDHLVVSEDLYGGTFRILREVFHQFGLRATFVDTSDAGAVESACTGETRGIVAETPTNPLMKIADLRAIAAIARRRDALLLVDNTFLTPYLQRPLELGADVVIHSLTKYLAGHNDVVAGALVAREKELGERLAFLQNAVGAIPGPQDCWLVMRGVKTLALRMEAQQDNARAIAAWLATRPEVEAVYYPGLPDHPGRATNEAQARGPGGMLSFSVRDAALVPHVLRRVRVIQFAESLGGVESLITYPWTQTHADIPADIRARVGIHDRLLRLSVGIEHVDDLIADLEQALGG